MKQAIRKILITAVVYCAICFIKGDYNALKWPEQQRLFFVLLVTLIHILDFLKREMHEIDK